LEGWPEHWRYRNNCSVAEQLSWRRRCIAPQRPLVGLPVALPDAL